ncbi:MAG: hypothetical protein OEZ58_21735, partial [Gammaproteobacteria bacterium]|nr:hypothetical protein [Gammaproteobacteria bacterium]
MSNLLDVFCRIALLEELLKRNLKLEKILVQEEYEREIFHNVLVKHGKQDVIGIDSKKDYR